MLILSRNDTSNGLNMDNFLLYFGIIISFAGVYFIVTHLVHEKYGYHTTGIVVEIVSKWSISGGKISYLYYPTISFKDAENNDFEIQLEFGSNPSFYSRGDSVEIIYYKNKIYPTGKGWKLFYALLILIGTALILYWTIAL